MSKQRYIQDSFWTDPYIESLNPTEKLLFLYYLTNPLCNIAGIYEIRDSRVSYELKVSEKDIKIIKNKFVKDKKILIFKDWIVLINFAKHQSINPNVKEGMQRIINALPSDVKALKGFERLSHLTLLNLTLPNTEQSSEGIPLKAKKNKDMKNYNEKNHSDSEEEYIDLDSGEEVKKEKPQQNKKAKDYIKNRFMELCEEYLQETPVWNVKTDIIVYNTFNKLKLKPSEILELMDWWFENEKDKKKLININNCLSGYNVNIWKVSKKL